jgi:16S rRNA (uracil1498-N3)-methyltransferase
MTRRRWIADEFSENHAALTGEHAGHLIRVLRARIGQEFDIAAGSIIRRGRIMHITDSRVEFELGEEVPATAAANLTLLLSVFKFDRMEWAIEKCTELGVSRIVPLIARRTESHLAAAATKRVDRWRKIALQAAEQSRRAVPPEIASPVKVKESVNVASGLRILLSERETQATLSDLTANAKSARISLAIGPEGGWTDEELSYFQENGWTSASLGPTILRAETAAIAAAAICISELNR